MNISVIIPVYNVLPYLQECLESILVAVERCKTVNVELICVDDGSTDGSGKLLDELAHESRFCAVANLKLRIIHKPNGGEGSARNAALDVATGDWLMYVDSDDVVASQIFIDVENAYRQCPNVDIIRICTVCYPDGSIPMWRANAPLQLMSIADEIEPGCYMYGVTEMIYLRQKFAHLRFQDYSIGADLVYTSQCFSISDWVLDTGCADYGYRIRPGSMAHRELSVRKMSDTIAYHEAMFVNFSRCGKRLPLLLVRVRGNSWFEGCASSIFSIKNVHEREGLWNLWLQSLQSARSMTFFTPWQRFVVTVMCKTRSRLLARLLLVLPNWLKLHGVHR